MHNVGEAKSVTGGALALFLNLYLGHLLGDFLFQPGRLVLAKRRGARGLFLHTGIVGLACAAALAGELREYWATILLIVGAHALIELVTIYTYLGTDTRGLFTFLLDQAMHVGSIVLVVQVAGAWGVTPDAVTFGATIPLESLAVIVTLIAVSFMGSILVFETANAALLPRGGKGELLRLDAARVWGFAERAGALAAALWLTPPSIVLPFVPRFLLALRTQGEARRRRLIVVGTGLVLCVAAYGLLRAADVVTVRSIIP